MQPIQRLVLIDDEPGVLRALALLLQTMNYTVVSFNSPVEAVNYLEKDPAVDLVVTDLRMPELSGDLVLRRVRSLRSQIPVIVMSGHASSEDIATIGKDGLSAFIPKPFSPKQFKELLASLAPEKAA